jgi:YD repeat-containing protein
MLVNTGFSQLMDNSYGNALEDQWRFNSGFIQKNSICEIRVEHSIKPDGMGIAKTGDVSIFQFDEATGKKRDHVEVSSLFGRSDTTAIRYAYAGGRLQSSTQTTSRSVVTDTLIYADSTTTVTRFKADITGRLRKTQVRSESRNITWPSDTTKIILSRNDIGLPYYKETWIWDSEGFLVSMESEFIISAEKKRIQYTYDKYARISERTTHEKGKITRETFVYDTWGNLEKMRRYEEEILVHSQELLLSANGLPEAILTRLEKSDEIVISKLFYRYCE